MKITLLGTGTPAPSLNRQSSGYLFEIGNDIIVMDHGPGAHQRLLEAGYSANDVTHCFITHHHYDHMMDYPRLLLTRWDQGGHNLPELKVFGPEPLIEINNRFIGPNGAFAFDIASRIQSPASLAVYKVRGGKGERPYPDPELREVKPGDVIEGLDWEITVGPVRHVQPHLSCVSYRLENDTGTVVYSGDNGGVYEPFVDFCKGADVLILMNHFLSNTELTKEYREMSGSHLDNAEIAKRADAKLLVLSHFLPTFNKLGVKEQMITEMAGIYHGPIVLGEDLMQIALPLDKIEIIAD